MLTDARWWVKVLAIFAASRVFTTAALLILAAVQGANPWTGAHPAYFDFAAIWDGGWYHYVSVAGYPTVLPMTDGHVGQNSWAFLPGYPVLVNVVMYVTTLPWEQAAVLVSVVFGAASTLMLYKLLRLKLDAPTTYFAVLLYCVSPVSPLFQVAYAEAFFLFTLAVALYLLLTRRYWWLIPVVAVMALTRPSGLAFALAMGMHVIYRWRIRAHDPFPLGERVSSVAVTVFSGLSAIVWPVVAALATGKLSAYTDTELAWRSSYIGHIELLPFTSWFQGAEWWMHRWLVLPSGIGVAIVLLLVAGFTIALYHPLVRRLGVDLRIWLAAYGIYLFAVFFPQSSTFRLLMPMFPLLGALAIPRGRTYRVLIVVAFLVGQIGWLLLCWGVDGSDWSPP